MESEQELIESILRGERAAMRRLYDRYSGYAMAVGLRYIPEPEEVRDVVQDSFVRILTSIGQFRYRGEGSLKNWVSRIVVNQSIDHLRQHERISYVSQVPDTIEEEASFEIEPPPDISDIPPDVLTEMIGRLPAGYRMVLNLYVFEQQPHREIAQRLGIRESTSHSQLFRARKMLAEMIKEHLKRQET